LVEDLDKNNNPIFKKYDIKENEDKVPRSNLRIWYSDNAETFDLRLHYRDVCIWQRDQKKLRKVVEEL
jgi:hypothetical protein